MSFGFSATDIVTAIGACKWLIDHGFSRQNAATVRYKQFESAIRNLDHTLGTLHQAIESAAGPESLVDADFGGSGHQLLLQECGELVGNFSATLKECRKLLEHNREVFEWKNNFVVNIRYSASMQSKVEDLQRRLQIHTDKLSLVLEPVRLQVMMRMEARIVDIQEQLWPTPELDSTRLTPALTDRFEEFFCQDAPFQFSGFDTLSRRDGLDALYRRWRESNIMSDDGSWNVPQYLNLLKAHFLVVKLKAARPYRTAVRGYPYQRAILQLQKRIASQYERPELSIYVEKELVEMPDKFFTFWDDPDANNSPNLDDTFLEDTLLHIELPELPHFTRNSLILKRMSPTNFRLISERVPLGSIAPNRETERVNMHSDRLIPWYATSQHEGYDLEIQNGNGAGRKLYALSGTRDIFALQRALTGYQVASDTTRVSWTISEEKIKIWSSLSGSRAARLQLWLWNPPSGSDTNVTSPTSQSLAPTDRESIHTATGTNFSVNSTGTLAKIIEDCDQSVMTVLEPNTPNSRDRADAVVAAASLGLPVLMIFTQMEKRYTYVALELDSDIIIDPRKCHCIDEKSNCRKAVIRRRSNHSFRLRMLSTEPGDIDTWDLSIFGRPAQFGLERHPLYNSEKVKKLSVKFLSLNFESSQARVRFGNHFKMAALHRDDQEKKVRKVYERFYSASARPREAIFTERSPSDTPRQQSVTTFVSPQAPRLPLVSITSSTSSSDALGIFTDEKPSPTMSMAVR